MPQVNYITEIIYNNHYCDIINKGFFRILLFLLYLITNLIILSFFQMSALSQEEKFSRIVVFKESFYFYRKKCIPDKFLTRERGLYEFIVRNGVGGSSQAHNFQIYVDGAVFIPWQVTVGQRWFRKRGEAYIDFHWFDIEVCATPFANRETELEVTIVCLRCRKPNRPPDAMDDKFDGKEDTALTDSVATNDSDPDNDDELIFEVSTKPSFAKLFKFGVDGKFSYVPEENYCGEDKFTYFASDLEDETDSATAKIELECVNDKPKLKDNIPIPPQKNIVTDIVDFRISEFFFDPDNDPLTYDADGLPEKLSIDKKTGTIAGFFDIQAGRSEPYNVRALAVDPAGASANAPFAWTVRLP